MKNGKLYMTPGGIAPLFRLRSWRAELLMEGGLDHAILEYIIPTLALAAGESQFNPLRRLIERQDGLGAELFEQLVDVARLQPVRVRLRIFVQLKNQRSRRRRVIIWQVREL